MVTTAKTSVRAEVQARSRGLYDVTFVPQEISPHFVNITFNDQVRMKLNQNFTSHKIIIIVKNLASFIVKVFIKFFVL